MSLVNDMLRDLDNRRKESGGSTASVKLTPAPEVVNDSSKRSTILYLVVALILGAGAVAWFWSQQSGDGTSRQLDIAPMVVVEPDIVVSDDETIAENSNPETGLEANQEPSQADSLPINTAEVAETDVSRIDQRESNLSSSINSQPQLAENSLQDSQSVNEERLSIDDSPADIALEEIPQGELTIEPEDEASIIALTDAPAQEVKNSAELTPEEYDLLAVQDALRLIADNKNADAYALLEKQIIENRYAHQSRETYAKLLIQERNLLGAYELNEAGLALSPNHSGFKKIKARVLIADGQLDAAVELLLSRAPAVDSDLEYHDILATAQLATRDYEGALISYTGLVQQDQNQGKWWYGFAASQDFLGNSIAARQGYSQAVQLPNLSASLRRRSQERLAVLSQ